jgi:chromate transporter
LVLEAMIKIGKRALKGAGAWPIAIAAFLALLIWSAPFPIVILTAAIIGLLLASRDRKSAIAPVEAATESAPSAWRAIATAMAWGVAWLAPLGLSFLTLGSGHVLTRIGQLFSTLAVVTFGGAYATLAYLQQEAVEVHGWLTAGQMIDGLGLAETTPGPLVLVNEFVGFVAGWQGGGGLALATLGALMAAWCTFAPSFVWIFAGAPFAERLRSNRFANGALKGITAAVLGVIANLALWFALHVVFGYVGELHLALGAKIPAPVWSSFHVVAALMCLAATIALLRFKVGVLTLIVGSAACGVAFRLVGVA